MVKVGEEQFMAAKAAVIRTACGICAETEERLLQRLEALYWEGFEAGKGSMESVLKAVSNQLAEIAVAHVQGNAEHLRTVLDDFVSRHVRVAGESPAQPH